MMSPNGSIPPIHVPPGYISQVSPLSPPHNHFISNFSFSENANPASGIGRRALASLFNLAVGFSSQREVGGRFMSPCDEVGTHRRVIYVYIYRYGKKRKENDATCFPAATSSICLVCPVVPLEQPRPLWRFITLHHTVYMFSGGFLECAADKQNLNHERRAKQTATFQI